jgi:hypothetical protein
MMRILASLYVALPLAFLSGCAIGPLVPVQTVESAGIATTEAAAGVLVVSSADAVKMTRLGPVVGHSCKNKFWDPDATADAATFQVKMSAAQRQAKAVTDLVCTKGSVSIVTNCWQSYTCKAEALR